MHIDLSGHTARGQLSATLLGCLVFLVGGGVPTTNLTVKGAFQPSDICPVSLSHIIGTSIWMKPGVIRRLASLSIHNS